MPHISKAQLIQLSKGRDLSTQGQGLGCLICFARQVENKPPEHFSWCWVGKKLENFKMIAESKIK